MAAWLPEISTTAVTATPISNTFEGARQSLRASRQDDRLETAHEQMCLAYGSPHYKVTVKIKNRKRIRHALQACPRDLAVCGRQAEKQFGALNEK